MELLALGIYTSGFLPFDEGGEEKTATVLLAGDRDIGRNRLRRIDKSVRGYDTSKYVYNYL